MTLSRFSVPILCQNSTGNCKIDRPERLLYHRRIDHLRAYRDCAQASLLGLSRRSHHPYRAFRFGF